MTRAGTELRPARKMRKGASLDSELDSRALYSQLVDNLEEHAVFVVLRNGRVGNWSLAAERVYGYRRDEILGKPVSVLVPPKLWPDEDRALKSIFAGESVRPFETQRVHKGGRVIDVWIKMSPVYGPGGRVVGVFKIVRDITERKKTDHALLNSEQKLRAILDAAVDAVITINERGQIESANPATQKLFGYSEAELLGKNVSMLMPEPYRHEHDGYLQNYARTGQAKIIGIGREITGQRKDGTVFPLNLSVSEVPLDERRIFAGIVHDLTERRRLEKQILEAAANEQRRIGQDLHDGLCQELVGLAFTVDFLGKELAKRSLPQAKTAADIGESIRRAAAQARTLAHGLNPVDVKAGGLSGALKTLAQKVSHSFGVRCTFQADRKAELREDAVATHFYRIAQEAVGNAIRHGKAKRVRVCLMTDGPTVTMTVEDNGGGLKKSVVDRIGRASFAAGSDSIGPTPGIGLQTMQYRARVVGGTFRIEPTKSGGTRVVVSVRRELQLS